LKPGYAHIVQEWIPLPGSAKGRLALTALQEFGARGHAAVSVAELAAKAGVTTGSLYHHFDGKPGLYRFARQEAERRLLDRMKGAAAARAGDPPDLTLRWVLIVGFNTTADQGLAGLLAERPDHDDDPVEEFLATLLPPSSGPAAPRIVAAAWRAALSAIIEGMPAEQARTALSCLRIQIPQ
jgi:AcrR family transcriptional regulator